ncbi:MAG TPA: exodeoxyribonuclease VII large subunit [Anaerolineaceae bacterium]|nr:exodeoxyribonuclease VII large subunit [Anaerolineaceae bacterium]HOR77720.1 exodeoxyribonuclease VII large subunit [Anaerolineaceae bacterium]
MEGFDFFQPIVFTVTALNAYLRELLETDEVLQDLWVRGEISNFSQPRSGHLYFTLKDSESAMRCVMWKPSAMRLRFTPADGMLVEAHGAMSIYPAQGQVQLYVDALRPAGEGALYQEFLRLRAQLEAEGLFDPSHKRPLPRLPKHIGVVTSATGAALHDILQTLNRRLPTLRVTVAPTSVQGVEAPAGIIAALKRLNSLPDLDLIILARGGGSIEDLWAFNDEGVARAIFASRYPVISGVGHETDFTIADFVADLRAPTPTGAAELATPITKEELRAALQGAEAQLTELINRQLEDLKQALQLAQSELRRSSPRLRILNNIQRLDELQGRLERAIQQQLQRKQNNLANASDRLASLNPQAVLKRGYAIITDQATGQIISHTRQASPWQPVWLQVQDGSIPAQITPPPKENKKDD